MASLGAPVFLRGVARVDTDGDLVTVVSSTG